MAATKYTSSVLTSSFNTPDENIDYAFQMGPVTHKLIADAIYLIKEKPCISRMVIDPPDGDCRLLDIGEEADEQLSPCELHNLRNCKPVPVHHEVVDEMKLSESQYVYQVEVIQRATQIQVVLVVGDEPESEARCHLDHENK